MDRTDLGPWQFKVELGGNVLTRLRLKQAKS